MEESIENVTGEQSRAQVTRVFLVWRNTVKTRCVAETCQDLRSAGVCVDTNAARKAYLPREMFDGTDF